MEKFNGSIVLARFSVFWLLLKFVSDFAKTARSVYGLKYDSDNKQIKRLLKKLKIYFWAIENSDHGDGLKLNRFAWNSIVDLLFFLKFYAHKLKLFGSFSEKRLINL